MAPQKIGSTYYLDEGLYINAYRDKPFTGGIGGGGNGSGGWGLNEGPRRGEGQGSQRPRHDIIPGWNTILFDELKGINADINKKMAPRYKALSKTIEIEINEAKIRHISKGATPYIKAKAEQRGLFELIHSKRSEYTTHLERELSFWGSNIFYKPPIYFISKGTKLLKKNKLDAAFLGYETSLQSAHERKIIDRIFEAIRPHLHATAKALETTENLAQLDYALTIKTLDEKADAIRIEQIFYFQALPGFLQNDLLRASPKASQQNSVQTFAYYEQALRTLAANRAKAITPYLKANPNIKAPLTSAELEALDSLIQHQQLKGVGPRWLDYHKSLLNKESARILNDTLTAFSGLNARAKRVEQQRTAANAQEAARKKAEAERKAKELAQQKADAARKAEELARQKTEAERRAKEAQQRAEAERQKISFIALEGASVSLPLALPIGAATFAIPQTAYIALQNAIQEAVTGLARIAAPVVGNILVGTLFLAWPSTLGNSERRYLVSVPLTDLSTPDRPDLAALALKSESIDLPYLIASSGSGAELDLYLTPGGRAVPVRAATFDSQRQVYSLALDNPQRILTWTPANAPGSEHGSPTSLPPIPPGAVVYTGSSLNPVKTEQQGYPALDLLDQERLIVTFPADSGLPPILVIFKDPRLDPGEHYGQGLPTSGVWLGDQARSSGAPIPSQISKALSGKAVRDMKEFREDIWKAVAQDNQLSAQFSEANLKRMASGLAPKVQSIDRHKSQSTFVLHHHIPVSAGGAVYDHDNIRVVTPKAHLQIHYGEQP
ncbi:S-type pyocin domain-containing protein [Pseudomonas sp. HTZ2]|uniref:S-type pyocin domain-containing protein n=1 Tax=Pseudomonas sp. HTZ2 TaxID=3075220 RepID=UPI00295865D2|nr:S-type pyocin domain-containing protein [Pseudomonas sp. HTZ2]